MTLSYCQPHGIPLVDARAHSAHCRVLHPDIDHLSSALTVEYPVTPTRRKAHIVQAATHLDISHL